MRIVLGSSRLIKYPQGGGLWAWVLQYPLGLRALGEDVFWLEILSSTGDRARDERFVQGFFQRLATYGLDGECAVLIFGANAEGNVDIQDLEQCAVVGRSRVGMMNHATR